MNFITSVAAALVAVGTIGGSYAWLDTSYTRKEEFHRYTAQARTGTVMELRKEIQGTPEGPWRQKLCETLELELTAICAEAQDHPFCTDRREILRDAGC